MSSIVIRLDPTKLDNPDADLRYEIPDLLSERSGGLMNDDGYDYEPEGHAMQIYLKVSEIAGAVEQVVQFLETEHPHGNDLAPAAQVGVSESEPADVTEFRIVYPPGTSGVIVIPRP
jgi:hypothetical protein